MMTMMIAVFPHHSHEAQQLAEGTRCDFEASHHRYGSQREARNPRRRTQPPPTQATRGEDKEPWRRMVLPSLSKLVSLSASIREGFPNIR